MTVAKPLSKEERERALRRQRERLNVSHWLPRYEATVQVLEQQITEQQRTIAWYDRHEQKILHRQVDERIEMNQRLVLARRWAAVWRRAAKKWWRDRRS